MRSLVNHAQKSGYKCAVLNQVGVLKNVPITSPRIFNFGNTTDYDGMIRHVLTQNPTTTIICIGYSLGGNLMTKYLGEHEPIPRIIAGISVCQGYDVHETVCLENTWENLGKLYLSFCTSLHRSMLQRWRIQLFSDEVKSKGINVAEVLSAKTLFEIDDVYSRKLYGYDTIEKMYSDWSCNMYWENISVPIVFINATDDPFTPKKQIEEAKLFVNNRTAQQTESQSFPCKKDRMLIEQKHGGHIASYEGGFWKPNPVTWLDRTVIALSDSLSTYVQNKGKHCSN
jgi:abhydrolase domain-containing protein 2